MEGQSFSLGNMLDFSKIDNFNKYPVRNQPVSDLSASNNTLANLVNNYNGGQQNPINSLPDNPANRVLPNRNSIVDSSKANDYSKMYSELYNFVDNEGKKHLQTLHENKKLFSNNSNDGSSTIENLYKLMTQPRTDGFDAKILMIEALKTLSDPYVITQDFGKIPEVVLPGMINDENTRVQQKLEEEKVHPSPVYERKEILKTFTPMETLKESAVVLAKKLGVTVYPTEKLEEIINDNTKALSKMERKAAKNPQNAAQFTQYQAEHQAITQAVEDINFSKGHTCPAASIEFDIADKKPAEFVRYLERLTSPDRCVKTKIKYSNIADDMPAAVSKLLDWKIDYKKLDSENIEVTLRPDPNAYIRSIVQEYARAKDSRSVVDSILQSTFMQVGSARTYNSLTDLRSEDTGQGRGLNQEEGAFIESIVDYEGGKDSVTYMDLDENLTKINKYNFEPKVTEAMLTETLNRNKNIMIGFLTDIDDKGNLITSNGHEILLTGIDKDKKGEKYFKYNDTDDGDFYAPSYIKVSELIRTLHHANIPKDIVKKYIQPQKDPRLLLISDYWQLKNMPVTASASAPATAPAQQPQAQA